MGLFPAHPRARHPSRSSASLILSHRRIAVRHSRIRRDAGCANGSGDIRDPDDPDGVHLQPVCSLRDGGHPARADPVSSLVPTACVPDEQAELVDGRHRPSADQVKTGLTYVSLFVAFLIAIVPLVVILMASSQDVTDSTRVTSSSHPRTGSTSTNYFTAFHPAPCSRPPNNDLSSCYLVGRGTCSSDGWRRMPSTASSSGARA